MSESTWRVSGPEKGQSGLVTRRSCSSPASEPLKMFPLPGILFPVHPPHPIRELPLTSGFVSEGNCYVTVALVLAFVKPWFLDTQEVPVSSAGLSSLLKLCTPQLSQPAVSHQSLLNTGPTPGTHPAPHLPHPLVLTKFGPCGAGIVSFWARLGRAFSFTSNGLCELLPGIG